MESNQSHKPTASISLDLDNQWSYLKVHGDTGWEEYPTYLPAFLPYVLQELQDLDLKITFFIVGKDADSPENSPYIQEIARQGHEIGNHSYNHESWLKTYTKHQIEQEIKRAEDVIFQTTGVRTRGFRGPGFSWSADLLATLERRGYLYDASTLPTYLGPLARRYYFMTAHLSREEKEARKELFGSFSDGFRPVKPYFWQLDADKKLLEIPVTTIPVVKTPFHLSYLLYLSGHSMMLMQMYLSLAIQMCRLSGTAPSFLLHPLDLIGGDELPELAFFPGMDIQSDKKIAVFRYAIKKLRQYYTLEPMGMHAEQLITNISLPTRLAGNL